MSRPVPVKDKIDARDRVRLAIDQLEEAGKIRLTKVFRERLGEILTEVRELERRMTVTIPVNQDPNR